MEYIKGGSLLKYLEKKGGKLSEEEAQFIMQQLV